MMRGYLRHPGSLLLRLLCVLSAVITGGVLLLVAGYVLCKGIPYLKPSMFAPVYNSENVSMLPALFNTIWMTLLSLRSLRRWGWGEPFIWWNMRRARAGWYNWCA